jgi:hypothetical protein
MTGTIATKRLFRTKTARMLSLISVLTCVPSWGQESPRKVLEEFCQMDAQGGQLTGQGFRDVSAMFTQARESRGNRSIVVRDFVVSGPLIEEGKAKFYVEYVYLGQLDESGPRFSRLPPSFPPGPIKVRIEYTLSQKHQSSGPAQWRIDGAPRKPHISVSAAIKYVEQLRARATSAVMARNADRTIAALRHMQ